MVAGDPELGSCLATMPPAWNNARLMIVAAGAEKEYRFALANDAWRSLEDGDLTLQAAFVDREEDVSDVWSLSTTATSGSNGGPRINWTILRAKNDGANFVDQMRTGYALWFLVDEVPIAKFNLDRSAAALDALDRCRSAIRVDENFDPFAR